MTGLILSVSAYYGESCLVGKVYARSSVINHYVVPAEHIVNHPNNDSVKDLDYDTTIVANDTSQHVQYDILQLLTDFEDEYNCKVVLEEPTSLGSNTYEFNIFEPAWADQEECEDVIHDLMQRLVDWVRGYPSGM